MMAAQRVILLIPLLVFLTQLCIIEVRAVDGNWGAWLEWEPCSASCGEGQRRRIRFCNNPPPSNGGAYCAGRAIQYQECEAPIGCPVDGEWSEWSSWTPCSVTCGESIKSRQRNCDSLPPANGGRNCAGSSTQRTRCVSEEDCPRNGGWSQWSKWSPCFVTCGGGVSFRYRECDNPPPSDNGKDCAGRTQETRECTAKREYADTPVCASPQDIEGAITSQLHHPVGAAITYTCQYGFESRNSSNNVSVCTANPINGRPEWTAPEIRCIVITCDPPKIIENGHAIVLSFEYGSELEYKCDKGFSLNTNETIYCTEDGIWSKTDVACIVITCDPPKSIENGHAIALSFEYGSELEYKCDKGFSLNTNETIYCTGKGIWSKTDVACIESCSIPHVSNGDMGKTIQEGPFRRKVFKQMNVGERVEDYEELVIRCFKGFEAADSGYQDAQIICGKGKWTPEPICNPAPCRSTAPFAANAEVVEVNRIHGGTVSYECLPDYKKRTEETVTCVNGEWLGETPRCESTQCSVDTLTSPGLQKGHKLFYRDGEVFEVTCNQNYRLDTENSSRIMCKEGTWTGDLTPCVPELFYEPCGTNRIGRDTRNMSLVSRFTNATEGTWPWMASIEKKGSTGIFFLYNTGFLIDKKHVVSTAEYFTGEEPHNYRVKLGSVDNDAGEEYFITRIVAHRGYARGSYYDNIAILTLSRDADIPNFVPVCLPENRIINMDLTGTRTTVAGWRYYSRRNRGFLMQLSGIPVLSNEECETPIRNIPTALPRGLTSDIFCTRSERDSGGGCWFTSGGPLMLLDRNRWYAIGIGSFASCTHRNIYYAYTRVTSYLDWITENTRD